MSDSYILFLGVLVFSLLAIGVVLTGLEYKRLQKEQTNDKNIKVGRR